jgi:hypothetical protein
MRSSFICGAFTRSTNFARPFRDPELFLRGFTATTCSAPRRAAGAAADADAGVAATAERALSADALRAVTPRAWRRRVRRAARGEGGRGRSSVSEKERRG